MPEESHRFAASPGDWLIDRMTTLCGQAAEDLRRIPDSPSEGIHALRVRMKELRALLRLTKGSLPRDQRRRLRQRTRTIKNAFASGRDAEVMTKLAATMGRRHHLPPVVLAPATGASPARAPSPLPRVRRQLIALRRDLAALPLQSLTPAAVIVRYARCERSCRRSMKECAEDPAPERLHQWRKRVKDWTYLSMALAFLPDAQASVEPARKLGSALGKVQDLIVLRDHVTGPTAPDWHRAISKSLRRRVPPHPRRRERPPFPVPAETAAPPAEGRRILFAGLPPQAPATSPSP